MKLLPVVGAVVAAVFVSACGEDSFFNRRVLGRGGDSDDASSASVCDAPSVKRLRLPKNHTSASRGEFTYAFEHRPAAAGKPTVVYIPGGPGQSSIGEMKSWSESLPAGYGIVLTDPRGVGCNYVDIKTLEMDFYDSRFVARDVLSVAKELKLDNYVLYGISYGTVVASIAGSLAETEAGWVKPKAVVLEGVLGRAFNTSDEADDKYIELWNAKLEQLASEEGSAKADQFKTSPMPLGFSDSDWGSAIRTGLMIGSMTTDSGIIDVTAELINAAVSDEKNRREWATGVIKSINEDDGSFTKGSNEFYYVIACQEVFPDMHGIEFSAGVFSRGSTNYCAEADLTGSNLFNAASWPITAPIYYLQGENDPATPAALAKQFHFDVQTGSPNRMMALVKEGGHNPMGLSLEDCSSKVWAALTSNAGFKEAVSGCSWASRKGIDIVSATETTSTQPTGTIINDGLGLVESTAKARAARAARAERPFEAEDARLISE